MNIGVFKCTECNLRGQVHPDGYRQVFCSVNHQEIPMKLERARHHEGSRIVDEEVFPEWCPLPVTIERSER